MRDNWHGPQFHIQVILSCSISQYFSWSHEPWVVPRLRHLNSVNTEKSMTLNDRVFSKVDAVWLHRWSEDTFCTDDYKRKRDFTLTDLCRLCQTLYMKAALYKLACMVRRLSSHSLHNHTKAKILYGSDSNNISHRDELVCDYIWRMWTFHQTFWSLEFITHGRTLTIFLHLIFLTEQRCHIFSQRDKLWRNSRARDRKQSRGLFPQNFSQRALNNL